MQNLAFDFFGVERHGARPETAFPPAPAPIRSYAACAEQVHQDLVDEFHRLNATHFDGSLKMPSIILSRRKSYGGYYQPARHRIVLSWQAYEEHGWDETLNTFRHEVAHIVHFNHSRDFWELAYKLGVTQRYASRPLKQPRTPHRYVYECVVCRRRVYRNRRLRKASCGSCDKVYNPLYALKLVKEVPRF